MKKGFMFASVMLFMLVMTSKAFAHCIWSEPPFSVDLGSEFTFNAYFAHADDPIEDRELTNLSLFVFSPQGQPTEIPLTEMTTYFKATAKLTEPGQHIFVLERDPNRYRLTEIRDFSKSIVWAGERGSVIHEPVGIPLEIVPVKVVELGSGESEITFQVLYNGEPVSGGEVEVFKSLEPNSVLFDEIAELDVPANGKTTITVNPAYRYVLETDHRVPARDVAGTGIAITEVRFRSTLYLGH